MMGVFTPISRKRAQKELQKILCQRLADLFDASDSELEDWMNESGEDRDNEGGYQIVEAGTPGAESEDDY